MWSYDLLVHSKRKVYREREREREGERFIMSNDLLIEENDNEQCTHDSLDVDDVYAPSSWSTKEEAT